MVPTEFDTNDPHNCTVPRPIFRKTFCGSRRPNQTERAISNELDRRASKSIVGDKKLERRVGELEKRVEELEQQVLEKHNEIVVLKRHVEKLNEIVKQLGSKAQKVSPIEEQKEIN